MSYFMRNAREPISSYTHFLGAVFFGAGALLLLIKCLLQEGAAGRTVLSLAVFGFSLFALYSASALYHFSCASSRMVRILRKLDHSMIYVLIAGTYTPVLLAYMPMPNAAYFTAFMWLLALAGILIKLLWFSAPRWLGTAFYLIMLPKSVPKLKVCRMLLTAKQFRALVLKPLIILLTAVQR